MGKENGFVEHAAAAREIGGHDDLRPHPEKEEKRREPRCDRTGGDERDESRGPGSYWTMRHVSPGSISSITRLLVDRKR
jgi:hypothetical protein